jgi:4-methylaminobutanoate oxidase (formaldehyde-forming)
MSLEDPTAIALGNEPIFQGGNVVGWATSGGYGYSVKKSIAYGYLPLEIAKPGTRLEIELFGERIGLTVEREPLFDPKGERIKA